MNAEELKIIITAEIDQLRSELQAARRQVEDFEDDSKSAFKEFNDQAQKAGAGAKKAFAIIGTAILAAGAALVALAASTKEYREGQAKLEAAFLTAGASAEVATQVYNDLYRVLGDDQQAVEAANHLAQLTTNSKDLEQWTKITTGVYATFGDSLTENLITNLSQMHVGNFYFTSWFNLDDVKTSVNDTIQDSLSDLRTALNMDLTFNNFSAGEEEKGKGFIGFGSFYEVLATKMGQGEDKAETLQDILTKLHAEIPSVNPISTDYNFVTDFIADGKKLADKDFGRYLASLYDGTEKTVEASITDVYLVAQNEARADKLAYLNAFAETATLAGISDIVFVTAEVDMSAYACSGAVDGILPHTVKATIALDLSHLDGEGGAYLTFNGMTADEKALLMDILTTEGNSIDGVLKDIKKVTKDAFDDIRGGSAVHASTTEGATYPDSTAIEGIGYLYV